MILEEQTEDDNLAVVISDVRAKVERGLLLSEAIGSHPKVFDTLYVAMIEAGEAAGVLDTVLDRVAVQIEKAQQIKRRIKSAMVYPTLVLTFACLVLTGMLLFLVPIFVKIFAENGGKLPGSDSVHDDRLQPGSELVVRDLPVDRRGDLGVPPLQEDG